MELQTQASMVEVPALTREAEELAVTAAAEEDPVPLDHLDPMESQETLEDQELQVSPASLLNPSANRPLHHHASLAPTANQDPQAHQDLTDNQEDQDSQERVEETQLQDHQDHRDHQETPEALDSQEAPDSQEHQHRARETPPEHQDLQEMPELQDSQENQERLEAQDSQEAQDPRDLQDRQAAPETMVNQASLAQPASQDPVERREFARSTAPSMVESSSRTELVVAKSEPRLTPLPPMLVTAMKSYSTSEQLSYFS